MMKKKKLFIIIPLLIVLIAAGTLFGVVRANDISFEKGFVIRADNGSYLYVSDSNGPTRMTDMSRSQKMFEKLETGDKVLLAHGLIMETYPGATSVYFCKKLESGDEGNLSPEMISQLTEMGWINGEKKEFTDENTQAVEVTAGGASMIINVPKSWNVKKGKDDKKSQTVILTPDSGNGNAQLICYPEGGFAVCGTGLVTETILDGEGTIGFYDNNPLWYYIVIRKGSTEFVALNNALSVEDSAVLRSAVENGKYVISTDISDGYDVEKLNVQYTSVSWSSEGEQIFLKKAAPNVYMPMSSKRALPTVVIHSKDELGSFVKEMDEYFHIIPKENTTWGAYKPFGIIADEYDESFFSDNVLLVTYASEPSGEITHEVKTVSVSGDKLEIYIESFRPEASTCDMAGWFISMELPKGDIENITNINSWSD